MKAEEAIEIILTMPAKVEKDFSAILGLTPVEILNAFSFKIEKDFSVIKNLADQIIKEADALDNALDTMCNASFNFSCDFDDFLINHPVLGRADKDNIYFEKPLFESIQVGMKEPQYTTALGWFLKKNQEACRLFIETLAEVANFPDEFKNIFPPKENMPIESMWEYSDKKNSQNEEDDKANAEDDTTENSKGKKEESSKVTNGNDVKNRKEIDNFLVWEFDGKKYGIIIEIKFGETKLHNRLDQYQKIALDEIENEDGLFCLTLSSNPISDADIKGNNGNPEQWKRVLWRNLMPKLDEKVRGLNDKDYRRFLSSLWRKTLTL